MILDLLADRKKIVLFDGECNLCDRSVQMLIRYDRVDTFRFASLQSAIGKKIQEAYGIDTSNMSSVILIDSTHQYKTKTAAIFSMARSMNGLWPLLNIFWIVPGPLRDWVYTYITKNRYRFFGKRNTCLVMTQDLRKKFLI